MFCDVTGRETRLPLTICADGLPPRLELSLDTLNTGRIFTKTSHRYEVVLANRGLIPAMFHVILPDTVFSQFIDIRPCTGCIDVDGYQALQIILNADRLGNFEELITIHVECAPDNIVMKFRSAYILVIVVPHVRNALYFRQKVHVL